MSQNKTHIWLFDFLFYHISLDLTEDQCDHRHHDEGNDCWATATAWWAIWATAWLAIWACGQSELCKMSRCTGDLPISLNRCQSTCDKCIQGGIEVSTY